MSLLLLFNVTLVVLTPCSELNQMAPLMSMNGFLLMPYKAGKESTNLRNKSAQMSTMQML